MVTGANSKDMQIRSAYVRCVRKMCFLRIGFNEPETELSRSLCISGTVTT